MSFHSAPTLFHFSFAVDNLAQARKFYGEILGCPEGRKLPGRADFNFFGHHLVAHLAPEQTVGLDGRKLGTAGKTPIRHFGAIMALDDFKNTVERLQAHGVEFLNAPEVTQKGSVREQMLMTVLDGCGNAVEFKGLACPTDVYNVQERTATA